MKRILALCQAIILGALIASQILGPVWAATFEQVNTTSTQTLTNKTYTNPIFSGTSSGTYTLAGTIGITSPSITNPSVTGTVSGSATYSTPTITGGTQNSPTINTPTLNLQTYAEGSLPSAATAGRVVWLADGPRGIIGDFGTKLAHLFGYNWIAEFYSNCNTAIAAISSTQATMVIGKTCTVSSSTTVPTTLTLLLTGTGEISVDSGQTLTLGGVIQAAPTRRIFTGAGSVVCASLCLMTEVFPEWFGGGPGIAAATNWAALDKSIVFLPSGANKGGTIRLQGGTYQFSDSLNTQNRYLTFRGRGQTSTRLQLTSVSSALHGIQATGTTGYVGVFDLELSTSSPLTTDQGMTAIRADATSQTLASNMILEVERVRSIGFNFGVYCDGGSSVIIDRCVLLNSYVKTQGLNASSISDPYNTQQVRWSIAEHNIFDNNSLGDHCVYTIHSINVRIVGNECQGSKDFAFKVISQPLVTGVTAQLGSWTVEDNYIHDAEGGMLVALWQNHVLPHLAAKKNTFRVIDDNPSSYVAVMVQANATSVIRKADVSGTTIDTVQSGGIQFSAAAGAEISQAVLKDITCYNWGIASSGTYACLSYNGAGTYRTAVVDGYFDGNSNGKDVSTLQVGGGFTHVQYGDIVERNTTAAGYYPISAPIGQTKTFAKPALRLYSKTGSTVGTTAVTTEETLGTYTLPANSFSTVGDCLNIAASGNSAGNANTKTVKVYFGSAVIATNDVTTAPNGKDWTARGRMCFMAASAQAGFGDMMVGSVAQTSKVVVPTETTTAGIVVKVTGQNGTANADDIKLYTFEVDLVNAP